MSDHAPTQTDLAGPSWRRPARAKGTIDPDLIRMGVIAAGLAGGVTLAVLGLSLVHHRATTIPVIEAPAGPVRIKPADPGGMIVAGADPGGPETAGAEHLAPPPEAPQLAALQAQLPAPKPAVARSEPAPAPQPALAAPPAPQAPPAAGLAVQLAAFDNQKSATEEWTTLTHRMPALLADRHPEIIRADHDGTPIWRLRTGGFTDFAAAARFCEDVRKAGAECSIAAF